MPALLFKLCLFSLAVMVLTSVLITIGLSVVSGNATNMGMGAIGGLRIFGPYLFLPCCLGAWLAWFICRRFVRGDHTPGYWLAIFGVTAAVIASFGSALTIAVAIDQVGPSMIGVVLFFGIPSMVISPLVAQLTLRKAYDDCH